MTTTSTRRTAPCIPTVHTRASAEAVRVTTSAGPPSRAATVGIPRASSGGPITGAKLSSDWRMDQGRIRRRSRHDGRPASAPAGSEA